MGNSLKIDKPLVKLFQVTNDLFYILDVNSNHIVKVNKNIFDYFDNNDESFLSDNDKMILDKLVNQGLFAKIDAFELEHGMSKNLQDLLDNNLHSITLQVTQNCNFRCEYCAYSGSYINRVHSNKRMTWDTAKQAIDFLHSHSRDAQKISIAFYGGEPVLEFELIKKVVEYVSSKFMDKVVRYNMTTNATLLNEEKIKFFMDNNFYLSFSIDGPEHIHNKHRVYANGKTTFNDVMEKLRYIQENYPDKIENILINAVFNNSSSIKEVIEFFKNDTRVNNIINQINFVNECDLVDKRFVIENFDNYRYSEYDRFKLFLGLLNKISLDTVSDMSKIYVSRIINHVHKRHIGTIFQEKAHPAGPCIPGYGRLFVDVDGKLFPCERVSEASPIMEIGTLNDGINIEAARHMLNIAKVTDKACRKCWAFYYCSQCITKADGIDEISKTKRLEQCKESKFSAHELIEDYIVLRLLKCDFDAIFGAFV